MYVIFKFDIFYNFFKDIYISEIKVQNLSKKFGSARAFQFGAKSKQDPKKIDDWFKIINSACFGDNICSYMHYYMGCWEVLY